MGIDKDYTSNLNTGGVRLGQPPPLTVRHWYQHQPGLVFRYHWRSCALTIAIDILSSPRKLVGLAEHVGIALVMVVIVMAQIVTCPVIVQIAAGVADDGGGFLRRNDWLDSSGRGKRFSLEIHIVRNFFRFRFYSKRVHVCHNIVFGIFRALLPGCGIKIRAGFGLVLFYFCCERKGARIQSFKVSRRLKTNFRWAWNTKECT